MSTATLHNEKKKTLVPQLRFQEFDEDWKEKKFSALLKEGRLGGNYENSESNNGIPVIKMGNLGRGEININKIQCLPENIDYNKEDILIKGDLLFNTRNTLELVGKVSIWRNELPFALYNSNLMRMKFHNEIESSNVFMNYNFNTKNSINQLRRFATGTTSVAAIYGKDLKSFNITFPTLPEQQKIASFLSAVDEKIQQLTRKVTLLEQYKKGVMQQLFSGKLRFKDENGKNYPEWEEKKLGDVLVKNSKKNKNQEFKLVQSVSNKRGFVNQDEYFEDRIIASKDLSNYYVVQKGDFAYNPSRIDVGSLAYKFDNNTSVISPLYISFKAVSNSLADAFLLEWFTTQQFTRQMNSSFEGSVRNTLSYESLRKIDITFPCLEEQTKIANFLSSVDTKIESTNKQINQMQSFKKGLLQQMFC